MEASIIYSSDNIQGYKNMITVKLDYKLIHKQKENLSMLWANPVLKYICQNYDNIIVKIARVHYTQPLNSTPT